MTIRLLKTVCSKTQLRCRNRISCSMIRLGSRVQLSKVYLARKSLTTPIWLKIRLQCHQCNFNRHDLTKISTIATVQRMKWSPKKPKVQKLQLAKSLHKSLKNLLQKKLLKSSLKSSLKSLFKSLVKNLLKKVLKSLITNFLDWHSSPSLLKSSKRVFKVARRAKNKKFLNSQTPTLTIHLTPVIVTVPARAPSSKKTQKRRSKLNKIAKTLV